LRALGLALVGAIALNAVTTVHADPLGSKPRAAGAWPGNVQRTGGSSVSHPAPGHVWNGTWGSPHWGPNRYYRGWGPYGGPPVPTYWVWGPSGGAFDYPFADWRGPTGGWGNP
jgi:hypothetical protein